MAPGILFLQWTSEKVGSSYMYDAEDFFPPIAMLPNFDPGTLVSTSTVTTGSLGLHRRRT